MSTWLPFVYLQAFLHTIMDTLSSGHAAIIGAMAAAALLLMTTRKGHR